MPLRAKVLSGRLVLDEPTTLPEGTELSLVVDDEGDDLDDADRVALHAAIERSFDDARAGRTSPVADVLARLRSRG